MERACANRIAAIFLFLGIAATPMAASAAPSSPSDPDSLPSLLDQAEARNPDLLAARQQVVAAQAGARYAGSLEAPHLSASVMNVPSFGGPSLTLSQEFPSGTKRRLLGIAASREGEMAQAEYERRKLAVLGDLKQAYYEYASIHRSLEIHHLIHAQLRNLRAIATSKYSVGTGLQQDAIRAQVEIAKLLGSQFSLEQRLEAARARINTLANRTLTAPISAPDELPVPRGVPDERLLNSIAEAHNPSLQAMKAQIATAEAQRDIAQTERNDPDYSVGVQVGRSMPGDMGYVGGMVSVSLPWLAASRFDQRIAQSRDTLAANQAQYQAQVNDLRYQVHDLLTQLQRDWRQIVLYRREIRPQSAQAFSSSLASYQVNKSDFSTVIENQKAAFEAQMDYEMLLGDYYKTQAKLDSVIGGALPEITKGAP